MNENSKAEFRFHEKDDSIVLHLRMQFLLNNVEPPGLWVGALGLRVHKEIHVEDAARAIFKRIAGRKGKSPQSAMESAFLDGVSVKASRGDDVTISGAKISPAMLARIVKAQKGTRLAMLSPIQVFVLKNWREIRQPLTKPMPGLGLWKWSTSAACGYINLVGYGGKAEVSNEAYDKMISDLALTGTRKPAEILDFRVHPDDSSKWKFVHADLTEKGT